ncbi:MAG: YggS family pyridoxal phosphate-dependent enzyme [Propionibacteriaceae bacterium]|nr:YggS family pyridoxal phosphate-dependent enzyme [Propionibacteriaceae bacterium]
MSGLESVDGSETISGPESDPGSFTVVGSTAEAESATLSRLRAVEARIVAAAEAAGRDPAAIRLLPVTKTHPASALRPVIAAGYRRFGENRVQELVDKANQLRAVEGLEWVVIGHLQTNKAKAAVTAAVEIQSLESLKLAAALQRHLEAEDRTVEVLIEVNTSGESTKFGLPPVEVVSFAQALRAYDRLRPRGLMTLALPSPDPNLVMPCFEALVDLQAQLRDRDGGGWDELSMGMSGDFEFAIAAGSTCVRIGSAIFGPRPTPVQPEPPRP